MAHPEGGSDSKFDARHAFSEAYAFVGAQGTTYKSTTGEPITAKQGFARDKTTLTIVFQGHRNRHGSVCKACWGFRIDCNGSRVGQCAEALDSVISRGTTLLPSRKPTPDAQASSKPTVVEGTPNDMGTVDDLVRWRRGVLRLLDALDKLSSPREGPTARINPLSREGRLPREIASCIRLVVEMRKVTEYQGKHLSTAEKAAAKQFLLSRRSLGTRKEYWIRAIAFRGRRITTERYN